MTEQNRKGHYFCQ